jgi:hypothetical protein
MPWLPELFSLPVVEQVREQWQRDQIESVPYYDGLLSGEHAALIASFAGEPELHDPLHGRIKGVRAFEAYVTATSAWFAERNVTVSDVSRASGDVRGFEEGLLHFDGESGRVDTPVAIMADHARDGRLEELRIYHSTWPATARHAVRPPLLQRDPDLQAPDIVGEYMRALAAGDADAIVATFEPDGYAREPAGGAHAHRGPDELRAFYEVLCSNAGGIPLEHCALVDDGAVCALEYNVVRWGQTELPPQTGVAMYARGPNGKLAAARMYDDVEPPMSM